MERIVKLAEFNGTEIVESEYREEIIRCRDCKQYKEGNHPSATGKICHGFSEFEFYGGEEVLIGPFFSKPNDFCAWAERMD